jgi:hypothetical protein
MNFCNLVPGLGEVTFIFIRPCPYGLSVSLVKVFRLEWNFFGVQSVDTVGRCITSYLLAGPACL